MLHKLLQGREAQIKNHSELRFPRVWHSIIQIQSCTTAIPVLFIWLLEFASSAASNIHCGRALGTFINIIYLFHLFSWSQEWITADIEESVGLKHLLFYSFHGPEFSKFFKTFLDNLKIRWSREKSNRCERYPLLYTQVVYE